MALAPDTLRKINGDQAVAELERMREEREKQNTAQKARIAFGLSKVAAKIVLPPQESQAIRTGEVPVVQVGEAETIDVKTD